MASSFSVELFFRLLGAFDPSDSCWKRFSGRPRLPLTVRDEVLFSPFVQQRSAVQTAAKTFCQG
jgi:hypothetical protein